MSKVIIREPTETTNLCSQELKDSELLENLHETKLGSLNM